MKRSRYTPEQISFALMWKWGRSSNGHEHPPLGACTLPV